MNSLMKTKEWKTYIVYTEKQHGFFNRKLMKFKIDVSGENLTPFEVHLFHRGFLGVGQIFR